MGFFDDLGLSSSISGVGFNDFYAGMVTSLKVFLVLAVLGGAFWWYWNKAKYKNPTVIVKTVGRVTEYLSDKAALVKKGAGQRLITLNTKADLPPPDGKYLGKWNGKTCVFIQQLGPARFTYIDPNTLTVDNPKFGNIDFEADAWAELKQRENISRYTKKTWVQEWLPQLSVIFGLLIVVFLCWVALDYVTNWVTGALDSFSASVDRLAEVCTVDAVPQEVLPEVGPNPFVEQQ